MILPNVTGLVATTMLNTKAKGIENKIPDTKAALNTKTAKVECKIHDITNLTSKAALNTKATEIDNKILDATSFLLLLNLID